LIPDSPGSCLRSVTSLLRVRVEVIILVFDLSNGWFSWQPPVASKVRTTLNSSSSLGAPHVLPVDGQTMEGDPLELLLFLAIFRLGAGGWENKLTIRIGSAF
jgi:hypothetical protein